MRHDVLRLGWIVLLAAGTTAPAATVETSGPVTESATVRLVTTRVRIEPAYLGDPELCSAIEAEDLRVSLRGRRIPPEIPLQLERRRVPAVHALLIDTSGSMAGDLHLARAAAADYVRGLPEQDRAMLLTFDDSVVLEHGLSNRTESLLEAIERVRMGGMTSLHDGLYLAVRELDQHVERPVVVLLTDGVDSGSIYERDDIRLLADARRDLIVFTIGLKVPQISRSLPSTKRFLQRLAQRTDGKYFDAPRASRLDRVFRRIRQALDNEAVLTFTDPDPSAEPGRVRVSTPVDGCRVRVYRSLEPPQREPLPSLEVDGARVLMTPDRVYTRYYTLEREDALRATCARADDARRPDWYVELADHALEVCALDMTMDSGALYSFETTARRFLNGYPDLTTRPLRLPLPPLNEPPRRPEQLMDGLAVEALALVDRPVKTDPRQVPLWRHARPYRDHTGLIHGRTIHDVRNAISRALSLDEEYGAWASSMLREEAERRLDELEQRLRRLVPDTPPAILEQAVRLSPEGQAILARSEHPTERDLGRFLFAWLGDISAHDLFLRWEGIWIDRLLAGAEAAGTGDVEIEHWSAMHRLLHLPSYTRTLALFAPVRDEAQDRIGFWRVVLPRPSWIPSRIKGWKGREEYSDLPMDFVPNLPFGLLLLRQLRSDSAELFAHLRTAGYRFRRASYELPDKPRRQTPELAFEWSRLTLELGAPAGKPARLVVEIDWPKREGQPVLSNLHVDAVDDERLLRLAAATAERWTRALAKKTP